MKKQKTCSHKFEHKIIEGGNIINSNFKKYKWLVHKCSECGAETDALLLEEKC